jgi:hypothetical protein
MAMFTAQQQQQPQQAAAQTNTTAATTAMAQKKPTGLFSVGNKMGNAAQQAFDAFTQWQTSNQPSYDGVSALPNADSFSADRTRIEGELFNRAKSDLDLRYKTETDAFAQDMANKGIDIGSERYKREKELFDRTRNQAYTDARFDALTNAGAEQKRLFDMALDTRKQGTTEVDNLRASRIADLAAVVNPSLAGQQVIDSRDASLRDNANRKADRKAAKDERKANRKFEGDQRERDRQVQREGIRARNSGGGSAGLDPAIAAAILERINKIPVQG